MAQLQKSYISLIHDDPELVTVGDFVDNNATSIAFNYQDRETDLLNYQDESGFSNRQRVFLLYTEEQFDQYAVEGATLDQLRTNEDFIKGDDKDLLIKVGTEILIPKDQIKLDNAFAVSLEPNDTNKFTTFVSENLKALLKNPNYKTTYNKNKLSKAVDFYPQITIWMWIRSIDQFIDISPFVQQVNTSSYRDGGVFELTVAPIVGQKDDTGRWSIKRGSLSGYSSNSLKNHYSAQSKLYKINNDNGEFVQEQYYFHNIINTNDLVFIRFETLDLERQDRSDNDARFNVSSSDIPNKIYDLIGFVDSNVIQINPQSAEIAINISGRDLSKTILDDGSYFYIQEFMSAIFPERTDTLKFRNRIYGRLQTFTTQAYRSIRQSINLVINQLSSTGYVPNDVFRGYGDRRNRIVLENNQQKDFYSNLTDDLKQTSLEQIKIARGEQGLTLDTKEDEKSQEVFNLIFGLINSNTLQNEDILTEEALTTLDNNLFIREQLLTTQIGGTGNIGTAINSVKQYNDFVKTKPKTFTTDQLKEGVWQIIDVEVDPSVTNVRIANTSIAEANGSISETIRQFCDDPFIEFFTDTYQDRFKFIARRPPFNYEAWRELVDLAVDIEGEDLITFNLGFDDNDVFTYYMLRPQAFLYGGDTTFSLDFLPAVVFPEYVDIWGSRPYEKVTNYMPYIPKVNDKQINFDQRQIIRDTKFMIDINAYLPFTRKGLITINGDRRIKKNTCIRLKQTGEICYVTSVENNYIKSDSIDRTTTLIVERCMVEKYIIPRTIEGVENKVSYFNIVNTDFDEKVFVAKDNQDNNKLIADIIKDWQVTKDSNNEPDVFNFFVNKRQFD